MSQSGSGEPNGSGTQGGSLGQLSESTQQQHSDKPNQNGVKTSVKSDLSNGFENRSVVEHQDRKVLEKNQTILPASVSRPQQQYPQNADVPSTQDYLAPQTNMFHTLTRRQATMGQSDERHGHTGQVTIQPYAPEKVSMDRIAYVSQTATQTLPVQSQPHFIPDYVADPSQYPQPRGQFEARSQLYTQQPAQYSDHVGYVTRDVTYRDSALYAHTQNTAHPVYTGASGGYVTVQHASQLPSQSTSPQPAFYSGVIMTGQPPQSAAPNYAQFTGPPQYTYSQYPQTVMNPLPFNPHTTIYTPQKFSSQQTSPNPQRYSQELTQYQGQPIIQPIAQNVIAPTDRSAVGRGPKPMVPPRVNSKITCDGGHRKSASLDVPGNITNTIPPKYETNQNVVTSQEGTLMIAAGGGVSASDTRSFLTPLNQTPRTRQDGLYVDSNGDPTTRDKIVDTIASECPLYVSRSEHRKSVSVDVTTSFPRRNDTITFTFPGESSDVSHAGRTPPASLVDKKWPETSNNSNSQVFSNDQRRVVEPVLRVSSMTFDTRQEMRKGVGSEIKSECCSVSPNQRPIAQQENRRSDYFEEHRRSPMPMDPKRIEEIRRSPMPFMPIRDSSCDRAQQKSPSLATQNFEKTRQELAVWAEQRQRHEIDRNIHHQVPIFTASPRSRNLSEERRDPRAIFSVDEQQQQQQQQQQQRNKDPRVSQAAFQPIPNISQNTIMEQRRHLRHVSADLTKHMELTRKDFDDQPITGSVANLVPTLSTASSQRASPNLCHQFPALSEAKIDTKTVLTVVTDFGENSTKPQFEKSDHIIHSHKKSHNISTNAITHSKSQVENLQAVQNETQPDKNDINQSQHQQMHNQQSLDIISEKLSQFERQQSDLQARLQCLQNQNQFLDQVAQFQHQQSDLQARLQCLQDRQATEKTLRQATEFQQKNILPDIHHMQLNSLTEHISGDSSSDKPPLDHQHSHRHSNSAYLPTATFQNQICQSSLTTDRLSPRIQHESSESERTSQILMALPSNSPFERSDGARGSLQYRLVCQADMPENIVVPSSSSALVASVTSSTTNVSASGIPFSGTLKKVPPEKPPRTSLIVQSPEAESNRSQPAIGLKQTPKSRVKMDDHEIQSTVESILGPGVKVIDCEKKSTVREEEVLLINGVPIALEGPDGVAIREAMLTGQIPPCDLLNQILVKAGILRAPVRLETSLSVKSSVVTKEEVTVARDGKVVDERSRETKDNNYYTSSTSEIWEPVGIVHRMRNAKPFDSSDESRPNSNASSDQGYTTHNSTTNVLRERGGATIGCPICEDCDPECAQHCLGGLAGLGTKVPGVQTTTSVPTIFGTVASDLNPKEGNSRRSLPQTPAGSVGGKGLGGGCGAGSGPGMVNGAAVDHQDIRDGIAINTEHALVYRDGNLVSGSLEALVQHMVPTEEYYPDRAYLFAFLLSARLFIKPHELLGEVCALCEHQQNLNGEGGKERLQRFVPRLVQLLAEWTETFPYDFRDERVMCHIRSITQKVAAVDAAARQEVSALLQNLLLRLTALERYEEALARLVTEAAAEQLTQVDVTELCPSATVLAQQLTHVELERLSYIGPEEFVQAFAKESPHLETSFKDMKKTRNLESYVQWFNRLSYFVATEVCKHAKKKQRVRVVEYWIETARECFNIGNFNSLMAIIAGLNMSPISRLKKTWSKVQSAKFSILEHQMDPSSNFSSYRSTLKAAMWRSAGATDERQRIVVPFFSLLVKDLYFLNEGCSNKLPNGHINFEKFWQLAKQVTEFIAWKQVVCPFEKNSRVIAFLQASPVLTENALALASFECEPPDNNPEKERYKHLKSELNAQ